MDTEVRLTGLVIQLLDTVRDPGSVLLLGPRTGLLLMREEPLYIVQVTDGRHDL